MFQEEQPFEEWGGGDEAGDAEGQLWAGSFEESVSLVLLDEEQEQEQGGEGKESGEGCGEDWTFGEGYVERMISPSKQALKAFAKYIRRRTRN